MTERIDAAEQKARTTRAFGATAEHYDADGSGFYSEFGRRLVERAGVRPGHRVLDVATGRGAALFPAARAVGDAGRVTGVDLAPEMIEATRAEIACLGIENISVQVMDGESLSFPDAAFDAVLCAFGIMFLPHLDGALAGFRRVLRAGGALGVSTFEAGPTSAIAPVRAGYQTDSGSVLTQHQFTEADLRALLLGAGWQSVEVYRETFDVVYPDANAYWAMFSSLITHVWYASLPADERAWFRSDVFDLLEAIRQPDGIHESLTALITVAR